VARKAPTGGCLQNCGPTTEDFFDETKLATLKLTFDPADLDAFGFTPEKWLDLLWDKWKVCNANPMWLPAKLEYESPDGNGNVTLERVGVRLRGSKSRGTNQLQGMKIEFQKLIPSAVGSDPQRRFADLNQINLLSIEKDNSVMLQCQSYALMRANGGTAPHCNHLQVVINGANYGVMESVEKTNDSRFLKHKFGDNNGNLYGASTACTLNNPYGASLSYDGDTFTGDYLNRYEIVKGDVGTAEADLIPMFKCADPDQTSDEEFQSCIADWIDVDEWLKVIAGESLISQLESFIGARRNVYMYMLPDPTAPHGGRFNVWGWDYDTGLQRTTCVGKTKADGTKYPDGIGCDPFTSVAKWFDLPGVRPELVTRLTTVFKDRYCSAMKSFLTDVYKPETVDARAAVLDAAMKDNVSPTYSAWKAEVAKMKTYMETQLAAQTEIVDAACGN
jgi:spore coat protein CotH